MARKSFLKTVRFSEDESRAIEAYLKVNPLFESFSSVARVATLSFIEGERFLKIAPPVQAGSSSSPSTRLPFLWDYDLSEQQAREVLSTPGSSPLKRWLLERLLTEARFEDVFRFVDVETLRTHFSTLRLPAEVKSRWEYAINRWCANE